MGRSRSRSPGTLIQADANGGGEIWKARLEGKAVCRLYCPKGGRLGCTGEAISFSGARRKFDALNIAVVGIFRGRAAYHEKFKYNHWLNKALASDPESKSAVAYRV